MSLWLLILLTGNMVEPIAYTSRERCEEAGKIFSADLNRIHVHYRCVPNNIALEKMGEPRK